MKQKPKPFLDSYPRIVKNGHEKPFYSKCVHSARSNHRCFGGIKPLHPFGRHAYEEIHIPCCYAARTKQSIKWNRYFAKMFYKKELREIDERLNIFIAHFS